MTDSFPPPAEGEPRLPPDAGAGGDDAYPWEAEPPDDDASDPAAPRPRHDAFTPRRKREFLGVLVKAGSVLDACRQVGVAPTTVYRHQQEDKVFRDHCRIAVEMAAVPVEIAAWQRAVEGVEQAFACGGEIHVRRRYSDSILRLLLQGSNPKKYGPNPGFRRKRLLRHERKQMEREIRAELNTRRVASDEEVTQALRKRLAAYSERVRAAAAAQGDGRPGWTRTPEGWWIPPGYGLLPGWTPLPDGAAGEGDGTPRDSV